MSAADCCNAKGLVTVHSNVNDSLPNGMTLVFCGHHYRDKADALAAQGFVVTEDMREELLASSAMAGAETE